MDEYGEDRGTRYIDGVPIQRETTIDTPHFYRCELSYNDDPVIQVETDTLFGRNRYGFRWGTPAPQDRFLEQVDNDTRLGANPDIRSYDNRDPETDTYVNVMYFDGDLPDHFEVINGRVDDGYEHSLAGWNNRDTVKDTYPHEITVYDMDADAAHTALRTYLPATLDDELGRTVTDALVTAATDRFDESLPQY